MRKNINKVLMLILAGFVATSSITACSAKDNTTKPTETTTTASSATSPTDTPVPKKRADTMTVGYSGFEATFNPFFSVSKNDMDVLKLTGVTLLGHDRNGTEITRGRQGEVQTYNGTEYTYKTIADCEIFEGKDKTIDYKFTLRDGVTFSDGQPLTADDVIFTLYVLCDPMYDGPSSVQSLPIKGLDDYRKDMDTLENLIVTAGKKNKKFTTFTKEQQTRYWDAVKQVNEEIKKDTSIDYHTRLMELLGGENNEYQIGVQKKAGVDYIEGITKTGEKTLTVTLTSDMASAIYDLGEMIIAPMHYYGSKAAYDYEHHKFGFTKGDLRSIRAKNGHPLGAGPYCFKSYDNNSIKLEANTSYWKGTPKIKNLILKKIENGKQVDAVKNGSIDLYEDSISKEDIHLIQTSNSDQSIDGNVMSLQTMDHLGYGYIGINADQVKVGKHAYDKKSKYLRKAFATLFSAYREDAIQDYYGELAKVIEYPTTSASWMMPGSSDAYYQKAYSKNKNGGNIYTDDMYDEDIKKAALNTAIDYFKAAGFTYKKATGKFTAAPSGAKLDYEVVIHAGGTGDHPIYKTLVNVKNVLDSIGITLNIKDVKTENELWNTLTSDKQEIWVASWSFILDTDMYTSYYSANIPSKGGTDGNYYHIADASLDKNILKAMKETDQEKRKQLYKVCMNTILDWAVEVPVYQRQDGLLSSVVRIDKETMTPDMTSYWNWKEEIEHWEMNSYQ